MALIFYAAALLRVSPRNERRIHHPVTRGGEASQRGLGFDSRHGYARYASPQVTHDRPVRVVFLLRSMILVRPRRTEQRALPRQESKGPSIAICDGAVQRLAILPDLPSPWARPRSIHFQVPRQLSGVF
jgi:hypothetical protein